MWMVGSSTRCTSTTSRRSSSARANVFKLRALGHGGAIVGVHDVERRPPDQLLGALAPEIAHQRRVGVDGAPVARDQHAVRRALDERAEVLLGAAQRLLRALAGGDFRRNA